ELAERRSTLSSCKREGRFKIDTLRRNARKLVSRDWVDERFTGTSAFTPLAIHIVRQLHRWTSTDFKISIQKGTVRNDTRTASISKTTRNNTAYSGRLEPRVVVLWFQKVSLQRAQTKWLTIWRHFV